MLGVCFSTGSTSAIYSIIYFSSTTCHKGETANTVDTWMHNSTAWARESGINILGFGADGDSKIRKYFHIHCNGDGNKELALSVEASDFTFLAPLKKINNDNYIPELMFPDQLHMIKKWRNQLLNTRRLLVMEQKCAVLEHISQCSKIIVW